jgi:hypothetical protein
MSDYDPFAEENETYDPFGGEYDPFAEDDQEYSTGRQAVVSFFEGAVGLGTEADALLRSMSNGMTYEEALAETQKRQSAFREDNEALATATEWGGIAAGFLVPGGVLAKSGQAISKGRQVALAAGEGAAMGAAYQYAAEDLETGERGFATGAVLGAGIGGLAGKFLIKNADEIQRMEDELRDVPGRGSHIWGDEGVADTAKTKVKSASKVTSTEDSAMARTQGKAGSGESALEGKRSILGKGVDTADYLVLGTREWIEKHAGVRAARLVSMSEQQIRMVDREVHGLMNEFSEDAYKLFENNPKMYEDMVNIGYKADPSDVGPVVPMTLDRMAEGNDTIAKMRDVFREINALDMPEFATGGRKLYDYFPRQSKGAMKGRGVPRFDDYDNPMTAMAGYAEDVLNARALAQVFFKGEADDVLTALKPAYEGQSRMDALIDMIQKEGVEQGGTQIASHNLAEGLRASLVASKQGGNSMGSALRKISSTGLLANWSNAMLNTIEGVTLPIYMNGVKATAQTMLPAVGATINSVARQTPGFRKNLFDQNWVNNEQMGLGRQFMGEVHADADKSIQKMVDEVSSFFYTASGVRTVNEMGQEIVGNGGVKRGMSLAKKAVKTGDYSKLARHPAAKGMTQQELKQAATGLASGDSNNPWVREWYAQTLGLAQPGYASSMPMGFNNHPNGRVFYGMLSYMNRQYNRLRTDIYLNAKDVAKYGINTPKGKQAYKDAVRNATVYTATMGMANGIWDDFRKDINDAYERDDLRDYFTGDADIRGYEIGDINQALEFLGDTTLNQLMSNTSSGFLNARAEEYGGEMFDPTNAPAVSMGKAAVNAGASALGGDLDPAIRFGQTYVPGVAQADRVSRALTGERLADTALSSGMLTDVLIGEQ